jgi:hypothetical protein
MDGSADAQTKALEFFKDWSNYLLVTTVAALGWVASGKDFPISGLMAWCIWDCVVRGGDHPAVMLYDRALAAQARGEYRSFT